ncbi:PKD domain-containing protein [Marinoscillum furvescens]|uniref:Gliding motility-associated-like protein n=1 Tax=Marinoscillum furvescens DSM 4134 TaxID=1122208 RepID=A0A3D9L4I5_MARFU|nr:PKD domain-containing protein [Marinoscillum furvescens]REE00535.1 gliding motility-associated-like protein [Marinoscillum furvescens DSM 4134]
MCSGTNSTTLTLSDYVGTIQDWESSTSASGPWTSLSHTGSSLAVTDLTATTYYRAIVANGVCSSDYSSIATVTVSPSTVGGTVSGATTLCASDNTDYTLSLSGHTGDVIRWERSLTGSDQWITIDETSTTLTYSDLQETSWFRAIVQSGVCEEVASSSAQIQIDAESDGGQLSGSQEVCSGTNSTTLTLSDYVGTIQDWESSTSAFGPWTSLSHAGSSLAVTDLTATTYYRAIVANGVCSSDYSSIATVTVSPSTDAGVLTGAVAVCEGTNAGTVNLTGYVGNIVRWEYSLTGKQPWAPIHQQTAALDYNDLNATTWYRAVVQSGVCEQVISNSVKITVDPPTVAGVINGTSEVCTAINSGALTLNDYVGSILKWQQSEDETTWTDLSNTTSQLNFENLTTTTFYRVQVQSGTCELAHSEGFQVIVNPLPQVIFESAEVCEGTVTSFTNTTTVGASYAWDFGDGESSTLASPRHQYKEFGVYTVKLTATSASGCVDSLSKTVKVNPIPTARFSHEDVCFGNDVDFSDLSVVAEGSIASYSWDFGDGEGSTNSNVSHRYIEDGTYEVSLNITTKKGCADNIARTVRVFPLPETAFTFKEVCHGNATQFSNDSYITSGSLTYLWDFGDGETATVVNPAHTFEASGDYFVSLKATSAEGCVTSQQQQVAVYEQPQAQFTFESICHDQEAKFINTSIGEGLSYLWDLGDGLTSEEESPTHSYQSPGLYHVTLSVVNADGCESEQTQVIRVSPLPQVNFNMDDVCLGEKVSFVNNSSISTGSVDYEWNFGDGNLSNDINPQHEYTSDGEYAVTITGTSDQGCVSSVTKVVTVYPLPEPAYSVESVCDGTPSQFVDKSSINKGTIEEYLWDFGDQTNSILANPVKQYLNHGSYDVNLRLKSDKGCVASGSGTAVVHEFPVAKFSVVNVCDGFAVKPNNESFISEGLLTYSWDFGDGEESAAESPTHLYATDGDYEITLTARSAEGCTDVYSNVVQVYATPEVSAGQDTSISKGYSVQLHGSGGVDYSWYPLDGLNNSNIPNPIATPMETTSYEVTVSDQYGCQNSDTVLVMVNDDFKIVANNVFTPDGNGQNDAWVIENVEAFGDVNVRVYDRYGSLVFQEKAYDNDWAGTYGNDILPDGTYFYVITFSESDQKYQGALTIIRNN